MKGVSNFFFNFVFLLILSGCEFEENSNQNNDSLNMYNSIELQGHRGGRGLWPENSLYAFTKAIELGVDVLEMDVVMTGDGQILVSHDPFFNSEISLNPKGEEISEEEEFSIYKMDYDEISTYDCGSKEHPRFPQQEKIEVKKPLLKDVLKSIVDINSSMRFNIEIKSKSEWLGNYQPESIDDYVDAVVFELKDIPYSQYSLQSFDKDVLYSLSKRYPNIQLSYLVEGQKLNINTAEDLGITLYAISPDFNLLNEELVKDYQEQELKVIPWTVNEVADMKMLAEWGVDGIITDYPDRWKVLSE